MSRVSRRCQPVPEEVRETADLLERRWQLSIIYAALTGALRFNEFAEAVSGISPRMLSERLRDLERAGLVARTVIPSSPPTVEYRLTDRGRRLAPIIEAMRDYAALGQAVRSDRRLASLRNASGTGDAAPSRRCAREATRTGRRGQPGLADSGCSPPPAGRPRIPRPARRRARGCG